VGARGEPNGQERADPRHAEHSLELGSLQSVGKHRSDRECDGEEGGLGTEARARAERHQAYQHHPGRVARRHLLHPDPVTIRRARPAVARNDTKEHANQEPADTRHGQRVPGVGIDVERVRDLLPEHPVQARVGAEEGERRECDDDRDRRREEQKPEVRARPEVDRGRFHRAAGHYLRKGGTRLAPGLRPRETPEGGREASCAPSLARPR